MAASIQRVTVQHAHGDSRERQVTISGYLNAGTGVSTGGVSLTAAQLNTLIAGLVDSSSGNKFYPQLEVGEIRWAMIGASIDGSIMGGNHIASTDKIQLWNNDGSEALTDLSASGKVVPFQFVCSLAGAQSFAVSDLS